MALFPNLTVAFVLLFGCGCTKWKLEKSPLFMQIVSSEDLDAGTTDASTRLSPGPGVYETWEHLHESLKAVLAKHGTVSWDPDPLPDFYFSGDWFHENSDGFGVSKANVLSVGLLTELQEVLAVHHKDAMLQLNGITDPIEGLEVLVTPATILVGWRDLSPESCEEKLRERDVKLD